MCHIGGLGPELTPYGRQFKLEGYAMRSGPGFTVPLSGMAVASFVATQKDQPSPPAPHYGDNNNFTLDQGSIFLAGGYGYFGGFSQFTYDGVGRSFAWDQLDLRATTHAKLFGSDLLLGIDLNNNPGAQDVWNTLPAWGFPFTESALAPSPAASTMLSGALAQRALGTSIYAWWSAQFYAEAGLYLYPGRGFLRTFGVDANDGDALVKGAAPYFRLAYQKDYAEQNFQVGIVGLFSDRYPGGIKSAGPDSYHDLGLDASWQFIGSGENVFQINARYTHEWQDLNASFQLGNASNQHDALDELHLDASYYWQKIVGFTVSPFAIWGSRDSLLYADNRVPKPDSSGVVLQVDYTPWGTDVSPLGRRFNLRIGAQYTAYASFNGSGTNFDKAGRSASDNNTFRLFTWIAF